MSAVSPGAELLSAVARQPLAPEAEDTMHRVLHLLLPEVERLLRLSDQQDHGGRTSEIPVLRTSSKFIMYDRLVTSFVTFSGSMHDSSRDNDHDIRDTATGP